MHKYLKRLNDRTFPAVVPSILEEGFHNLEKVEEVLIVLQPAPLRPRGLTREVQALNVLSKGFDGPYWRTRSAKKRKRANSEPRFTSVN
jgi:hypothetical protein